MIEQIKFPGTVELNFGPINEGNPLACQISMPVCYLQRHKWAQPMRLSKDMLSYATFLTSEFFVPRTVAGMKNRIQEFGQFMYKDDYIGVGVRAHNLKEKFFDVTYALYKYEWFHGPGCTEEHELKPDHKRCFSTIKDLYWYVDPTVLLNE